MTKTLDPITMKNEKGAHVTFAVIRKNWTGEAVLAVDTSGRLVRRLHEGALPELTNGKGGRQRQDIRGPHAPRGRSLVRHSASTHRAR